MKNHKNVLTLAVLFGLWLGLVLGCKSSTQKTRETAKAITISADDLYQAYETNEAEADKLYQGKILIVTGTVGTTDVMARNAAVTLIDARQKGIVQGFGFAPEQKDAVSKLEVGQTITVKGKCMGHVMGRLVVLQDSVLQ